MRIVIVEDNESVAKGISYVLQDSGHGVDILDDGLAADAYLRDEPADLIILDVNLPGLSGLDLVKRLRARGDNRPVLMLTARDTTNDRIAGLDAGADDYLIKPFEMAELEARVRALARRRDVPMAKPIALGEVTFDPQARVLEGPTGRLTLPRRELAIFETLIEASGRILSKTQLLDALYGAGSDVEETVVEVHISRLRKRLKPLGLDVRVHRGVGYELRVATP